LKIGDFGCAIYTQTLRKTVVGCLAYSSPEQLKNSLYDDKIDAWSVGILTYELLTGKSPFDNDLSKVFNN
jgi:serine/threonine protein kinase